MQTDAGDHAGHFVVISISLQNCAAYTPLSLPPNEQGESIVTTNRATETVSNPSTQPALAQVCRLRRPQVLQLTSQQPS